MKNNKLIVWLIVLVAIVGLVLVGLVGYKNDWIGKIQEKFDRREKYVTAPGTPEIDKTSTNINTTTSNRGLLKKIIDDEFELTSVTSKNETVKWKMTSETTAGCTDDLYVDLNGQTKRMSEQFLNYTNEEEMLKPLSENSEWFKMRAKIGQPVLVFGDKKTMTAKTIYLFIDKCI